MCGLTVEKYFIYSGTVFKKLFKIIGLGVFDVGIKTAGADTALHGIPQCNAVFQQMIYPFLIADFAVEIEKLTHYLPETIMFIRVIFLPAQ